MECCKIIVSLLWRRTVRQTICRVFCKIVEHSFILRSSKAEPTNASRRSFPPSNIWKEYFITIGGPPMLTVLNIIGQIIWTKWTQQFLKYAFLGVLLLNLLYSLDYFFWPGFLFFYGVYKGCIVCNMHRSLILNHYFQTCSDNSFAHLVIHSRQCVF